jgi:mRNA degradation ribonuclease J1/J2
MATIAEPSPTLPETQEIGRQRVQIDFTSEAVERLQQIKEMAEAKTNAEVVRNALRLYEWFLRQKKENYTLQLVKNNRVKEVEIFF